MASRTRGSTPTDAIDYRAILERIHAELEPEFGVGQPALYIPELARVSPRHFGMALATPDGAMHTVGEADRRFSIQSISKVFALALAIELVGDGLWKRCGREPSGNPFNSLVQLEHERGIPRNPFINAGALVITDVILSRHAHPRSAVLELVRRLAGEDSIGFDEDVARSEVRTGHRNAAMAHFLKSFGNLENAAVDVLDAYFHDCSIAMSCAELAAACLFLANRGRDLPSDEAIVSTSQSKYLNALMLTCGTYDAVGDFAYRVGLPAKSGVGGGIVAAMPGEFSVCVWAPGLDPQGNSILGCRALELLTTYSGVSVF